MKNTLVVLLATSTLTLGVACILQWRHRGAQNTEINSLRGEIGQRDREIAELQAEGKLIATQRREALDQAGDLAAKLRAQREATARATAKAMAASTNAASQKPAKGKGAFGELFSEMMEDPEARKMIRESHRAMMNQLYDPLIKQMGLTAEEAAQFKDLLADNLMQGAARASSLFSNSASNRTELLNTLAGEQKALEDQLRQILGETRYAQYKDYQETVQERTQLNQFRQQVAGGNALTDQQNDQLLAFMREEKRAVTAATGQTFPRAGQDAANLEVMLSGDAVQKLLQAQESVNQRVYERARSVLAEDQLAAFGRFQTNQLQMMRLGMNMARKFMAPK